MLFRSASPGGSGIARRDACIYRERRLATAKLLRPIHPVGRRTSGDLKSSLGAKHFPPKGVYETLDERRNHRRTDVAGDQGDLDLQPSINAPRWSVSLLFKQSTNRPPSFLQLPSRSLLGTPGLGKYAW